MRQSVEKSAEILEFPRSPGGPAARQEEAPPRPTPIAWFFAGSALLHGVALLLPVPLIHDEVRLPAVLTPLTVSVSPGPEAEGADAPRPAPEIEPEAPPVSFRTPLRPRAEAMPPAPTRAPSPPTRGTPSEAVPADPSPLLQADPPQPSSAGGLGAETVPTVEPPAPQRVPVETLRRSAQEKTSSPSHRGAPEVTPPSYTADYLRNPPPEYPLVARRLGQEGWVVLRVKVDPSGAPAEVHLTQSSGVISLDQAALEAVRRWTFVPARRGEEAVAAWVEVPIRFQLREGRK